MRHVGIFISFVLLMGVFFSLSEVKGEEKDFIPFCEGEQLGERDNWLVLSLTDPFASPATDEAYDKLKKSLLSSEKLKNIIYCQGGVYNSNELYEWLKKLVKQYSVQKAFMLGLGYDALLNDPRQPWRKVREDGSFEKYSWKELDHFLVQKPLLEAPILSLDNQPLSSWYKAVEEANLQQVDGYWKITSDLSNYHYLYVSQEIPVEAGAEYQLNFESELHNGKLRLGVLDAANDVWIGGYDFQQMGKEKSFFSFKVHNNKIKLVLHNNVKEPTISQIDIHDIFLKKVVKDVYTYEFVDEKILSFTKANISKIKKLLDSKQISFTSTSVWMPFFQISTEDQRYYFNKNRINHLFSINQAKLYLTAYDEALRQEIINKGAAYASLKGYEKNPRKLAGLIIESFSEK